MADPKTDGVTSFQPVIQKLTVAPVSNRCLRDDSDRLGVERQDDSLIVAQAPVPVVNRRDAGPTR
jgi:hypothetical protein